MLELEPVGRHTIYVCTNLSCQLRGAQATCSTRSREATGAPVDGSSPDGEFHLRSFECLGACDIAPMASIEGHYRGPLTPEDARTIAEHLRAGGAPERRAARESYAATTAAGARGEVERDDRQILFKHIDVPDLQPHRHLRAPRRLPRRCARR